MEADITYAEQKVNFYYCDSHNRKYRMYFFQQSCDYLGSDELDNKLKSLSLEHTYSKCQNIVRLKNIDDSYKHSQDIRKANLIDTNAFAINRIYSFIHNGKITIILETGPDGNKSQSFTYDYLGFLTHETGGSLNMIYAYDNNGNMTYKQNLSGGTPVTLTYDNSTSGIWADRLLSYDGKEIKYDPKFLGNPKYFGTFNGQGELISGITYGWEGKNLTYYHNSETQKEITYAYNDANLRISKTVNSVLTSYTYEGNRLVMEQSGTKTKRFLYDEMGLLIGFSYQNGSSINRYFYIRDQLGHILGIVDTLGTVVVRYTYDAWGNILSVTGTLASTIGAENPFRYKGYYYDSETGYYYCQSRYYVPLWCRWLSSDKVSYLDPESINGINLYMYCGNNPVMYMDECGHFGIFAILALVSFSALVGGGIQAWSNYNAGLRGLDLWQGVAGAAIGTAINTLLLCIMPTYGGLNLLFAATSSGLAQSFANGIENQIRGKVMTGNEFFQDWILNTSIYFAGNMIGSGLIKTNSGWFQPKSFLSAITKSYGTKILMQSYIGSGISGIINLYKKYNETQRGEMYASNQQSTGGFNSTILQFRG